MGGLKLKIAKSLHDALLHFHTLAEADVVCIKQSDDEEVSVQLANMKTIY